MNIKKTIIDVALYFLFLFIARWVGMLLLQAPYIFVLDFLLFLSFTVGFCFYCKPSGLSYLIGIYLAACCAPGLLILFYEGFKDGVYAFLIFFVFELLAVICGWMYFAYRKALPALIVTLSLLYLVFFHNKGWLHFEQFGTLNGRVHETVQQDWIVTDESGLELTSQHYRNKIVVFDFWNTHCSICFKKFPELQALHDRYAKDTNVVIAAVNLPYKGEQPTDIIMHVRKKGHSFPVVINQRNTDNAFGVQFCPTLIIFRNEQILFRGDIASIGSLIDDELKKQTQ